MGSDPEHVDGGIVLRSAHAADEDAKVESENGGLVTDRRQSWSPDGNEPNGEVLDMVDFARRTCKLTQAVVVFFRR